MLDSDTKRKIDTLRDILVGKIPNPQSQVEQITTGLIYKFMDDMDQEALELGGEKSFFTGEYEKYAWKNLFDSKLGGEEKVKLYSEAVENMYLNPTAPQLFREIFKNAFLPFKDPSTLNMFLKEIDEFHYSHSEKLGDAFEYLLSFMGSQGDAGQFRTPRHIIDFIVEIVNPQKHESVLDPACGSAGFLISSYKHILKNNTDKRLGDKLSSEDRKKVGDNLNGYDISPEMIRLSLVNMYLHGFQTPKIEEYDTLSSEDKWNEYFDVILANPPFFSPTGGIQPHNRFGVSSRKAEVLFTSYILEHLKPEGRAGIIVPEGIIFQTGTAYKELRKQLIENGLVGVISLPAGVFNPYSGVKTSILIIDKQHSKISKKIYFGHLNNDGYDLGAQRRQIDKNDIPNLIVSISKFRADENHTSDLIFGVQKEEILENETIILSSERYSSYERNDEIKYESLENLCATIEDGDWIESKDQSDSGIRLIQTGNIGNGIYLDKLNKSRYVSEETFLKLKCRKLEIGEVLVSRLPDPVGRSCLVPILNTKMITSVDVAILKFHESIMLSSFFIFISQSDGYKKEITRYLTGASRQRISKGNLLKVEIPLPSIEIQQEIVDELEGYQKIIDGCKQVVENYKPTIDIDPSWEMVELGELCSLMTGGTPKSTNKEFYEGGDILWLVSGDIHKGEIFDCEGRITKKGLDSSNAKLLPKDSVMIALNGQGKTRGTVAILRVEATCNQSLVSILPNDKDILLTDYLFVCLSGMYQAIRNLTGDNQRSGLNMPIIRSIKIPLAPIVTQKEIVQKIEEEKKVIEGNKKLIEIYTQKIQDRINKVWGED